MRGERKGLARSCSGTDSLDALDYGVVDITAGYTVVCVESLANRPARQSVSGHSQGTAGVVPDRNDVRTEDGAGTV